MHRCIHHSELYRGKVCKQRRNRCSPSLDFPSETQSHHWHFGESRKEPTSCWATNPLNLGVHHPSGRSYTENFALPLSQLWQITGSARSQTKPSIAKSSSSTGERRASVQASLRNSFLKYFPSPGWSWYWFWSHGHNHSSLSIYAQRTAVAGFPGSPLCSPR